MKVRPESTKHKHALLKFDINGVPVGATVTAATLKVNVRTAKATVDQRDPPADHGLGRRHGRHQRRAVERSQRHGNSRDVGQPVHSAPATTMPASIGTITPSTTGVKTADVKSLVQGWNNNTFPNNGLVLLLDRHGHG